MEPAHAQGDEAWPVLASTHGRAPLAEFALVLSALGIAHRLEERLEGWLLRVPADDWTRARRELGEYQAERAKESPPAPVTPAVDDGRWGIAGFLLVIWAVPWLQGEASFGSAMLEAGRMQAGRVEAGEWWRTLTALTLHGDSGHILSNSAFGAFFGLYVARGLGSGVGWLAILLAGALGNALNAQIQADAFRSIGASTAPCPGSAAKFAAAAAGGAALRPCLQALRWLCGRARAARTQTLPRTSRASAPAWRWAPCSGVCPEPGSREHLCSGLRAPLRSPCRRSPGCWRCQHDRDETYL